MLVLDQFLIVLTVGFLMYLLEDTYGFKNGECRTYTFVEGETASLVPFTDELNEM